MKKRTPDKFWFPWWPDKWIFGSVRIDFTLEERAIWVDLLSLASKDDGHIRANEDTPYPTEQLAGMLVIPLKTLNNAIEKFIKLGKLTRAKNGTLYVTKWEKYQFTDRHKRRIKDSQGDTFSPEYKTFIPCPDKYKSMATKKGLIRVSRLIVAIAIDRNLKKGEQVHHKDEDDKNDDVTNLMLFENQREHLRYQHGYEAECLWRGDNLNSVKIEDIGVKIKDVYIILNNKKVNNKKEDKTTYTQIELNQLFNKWWERYPKKEDKGKAKEKWLALVVGKKVDPQELEDALTGYINILNNEQTPIKFIKQAKTFLYNGNEKKEIESTWRPYIKYSDPKYKSKPQL